MRPSDGEPDLGPWEARPARAVTEALVSRVGVHRTDSHRTGPLVVAVDGRSGGGKSTAAALLVAGIPQTCVIHTDDVAWWQDAFGWEDLLVTGVLEPAALNRPVAYRPPAWEQRGREGAVVVPPTTQLLVVEGVGSSRRALADHLDATVWVQSDEVEAYRRGIDRDVGLGRTPQEARDFWAEWTALEEPFLAEDRPWERADVVLCGTPSATGIWAGPGQVLVSRERAAPA